MDEIAKLLSGDVIEVDTDGFENDFVTFKSKDDVLTLMIHLGYLAYGEDEFRASTKSEDWIDTFKAFKKSQELLTATWS